VDYFSYRNFQTHFDNRVFGIIEDGTKAMMAYYLHPQEQTPELETLRRKANAWLFGMKWQIYADIKMLFSCYE
jgi:uncharacterized membrane protein